MTDDILRLPIGALELGMSSLLEELSIQTIGDLYSRNVAELRKAGFDVSALTKLADTARRFHIPWASIPPSPQAPIGSNELIAKRFVLSAEMIETFSVPASQPIGLTEDDVAQLDPTTPSSSSSRALRLFRRVAVVRELMLDKPVQYLAGVFDVSQLPKPTDDNCERVLDLFDRAIRDLGIKPRAYFGGGCARRLLLYDRDAPKARAYVAAHANWIADGPAFLGVVPRKRAREALYGLAWLRPEPS